MESAKSHKILKVKDWLEDRDEVTKLEKQIRKVIDDVILQKTKGKANKIVTNSELTSMIKDEINYFLKEKNL